MIKLISDINSLKFLTAIMLSMFLHSAVITEFSVRTSFVSKHRSRLPQDEKIVLEFIPVSEDVLEKQPSNPTRIISEKSTVAQNLVSKPELPKKDPYQRGIAEHKAIEHILSEPSALALPSEKENPLNEKKNAADQSNRKHIEITPVNQTLAMDQKKKEKTTKQQKESIISDTKIIFPKPQGKDDFTSPAQKNISSITDILGEWNYNSQSHAIARYFSKELKRIANIWNLELLSALESSTAPYLPVKKTVVVFKIMPDGRIEQLQIIEHDGSILSQRYPVMAIEKAAPFRPLPKNVLSYIRTDGLWIKIDFNYNNNKRK